MTGGLLHSRPPDPTSDQGFSQPPGPGTRHCSVGRSVPAREVSSGPGMASGMGKDEAGTRTYVQGFGRFVVRSFGTP